MVGMAQLASASDCGSEGRGFESLYPPFIYSEKSAAQAFTDEKRSKDVLVASRLLQSEGRLGVMK